ncbi:hypothetical protein BXT84_11395 [Sulfobacillus thermotolerans]|uniref:Replication restart protein PriA n=1 Tax=Sulfobacillus thermotolerans TaxID=338644 RepID=A0ABM6RSR3_9FIRM|nr:hypothetical protein BXT84_11395 [Sulfobacillus thermotolerans]
MRLADVVLDRIARGLDRTWTYEVPAGMEISKGCRVRVPFGKGKAQGIVLAVREANDAVPSGLKCIEAVTDNYVALSPLMVDLGQWMAEEYLCFPSQAYKAMLPNGLDSEEPTVVLVEAVGERAKRASKKQRLWTILRERGPLLQTRIHEEMPELARSLRELIKEGSVVIRHELPQRLPQSIAPSPFTLTTEQQQAAERIITSAPGSVWLLEGVTGSGKTEVYLQAIESVLRAGGQALVLVPEIALTPQTVLRFSERFINMVGLWHSGLSPAERTKTWHDVRTQRISVVVGVRSAVFLPFAKLGLIVMDEEHESTYKQEEHPRYHTREVAMWLARQAGVKLVLGSATPSLETAFYARQGLIGWIRLDSRVGDRALPPVTVVDMRHELKEGNHSIFSSVLQDAVSEALEQHEQVILFLNRRGYASFVLCRECGKAIECPRCAVTMTYHQHEDALICHYCFYTTKPPRACPSCHSPKIRYFGAGTERVVEEVQKLWPNARVSRADRDTLRNRAGYEALYFDFVEHKADVLVGTQMIAKGMDFPNVSVVGIIAADVALHLPDFRRAERTFQLMVQASGRTGRGNRPGTVVVQTYDPDHFAIAHAARHDYDGFYRQEIEFRQELQYPPFANLWLLEVADASVQEARRKAERVAHVVQSLLAYGCEILGPAPAPLPKLRERYRFHILVKGPKSEDVYHVLRELEREDFGCRITVDPYYML